MNYKTKLILLSLVALYFWGIGQLNKVALDSCQTERCRYEVTR